MSQEGETKELRFIDAISEALDQYPLSPTLTENLLVTLPGTIKDNALCNDKYSSDYEAKFGGAFGLGYRFNLSEQSAMEFDGVYQIIQDDLNYVSLRLGIMILLDKI